MAKQRYTEFAAPCTRAWQCQAPQRVWFAVAPWHYSASSIYSSY